MFYKGKFRNLSFRYISNVMKNGQKSEDSSSTAKIIGVLIFGGMVSCVEYGLLS